MSALVDRALAQAELTDVLGARKAGDFAAVHAALPRLRSVDLLALGALADRVRALEVGEDVRIFANVAPDQGDDVVTIEPSTGDPGRDAVADSGLGFLREVAIGRITGPRAARVRVDWSIVGLELAQVALGFGASELLGPIASKRGLPIAEGEMSGTGKKSTRVSLALVKKRELAGFVSRSGRRPVFVGADGAMELAEADDADEAPAGAEDQP